VGSASATTVIPSLCLLNTCAPAMSRFRSPSSKLRATSFGLLSIARIAPACDIARMLEMASELGRLATGMATDKTEIIQAA
jgi:hypothetical protein